MINEVIEALKVYTDGKDNAGKVEISVMQLNRIIKALEKPTDAISRQAVDDAIYDYSRSCDVNYAQIMKFIDKLPSVTPQPKMGQWLNNKCSECGKGIEDLIDSPEWYQNEIPKYCPFCGIKIQPYKDRK